jgi:hypothetical protein
MDSQALQGCDKLHYLVGDSASEALTKGAGGIYLDLAELALVACALGDTGRFTRPDRPRDRAGRTRTGAGIHAGVK